MGRSRGNRRYSTRLSERNRPLQTSQNANEESSSEHQQQQQQHLQYRQQRRQKKPRRSARILRKNTLLSSSTQSESNGSFSSSSSSSSSSSAPENAQNQGTTHNGDKSNNRNSHIIGANGDFSASAITTTTTTSSPPQTNAVHLPGYYTLLRSVGMHEIPEIMIEPSRNPPYSRGENGNNLRPISSIQLAVVQPSFIPLHGFLPPPQLLQSQNQQDRLIVGVRKSSNTAFVPSNQPTTDAVGESGNTGPGTVISTAEGLDFLFIHPDDLRSALSSTITSEQAMYDGGIVNVSETSGFY